MKKTIALLLATAGVRWALRRGQQRQRKWRT